MLKSRQFFLLSLLFHLIVLVSLFAVDIAAAQQKGAAGKKNAASVIDEAQIQGQMMAFADRYWSTMNSAAIQYVERSPSPENLRIVRGLLVYSAADAFTIAAGPKPVASFLDMVVMVTLGRMVFEEHFATQWGDEVAPIVEGFRKAEADIWAYAGTILTKEQQNKMMGLITDWRRENPDLVFFSSVRFSEFGKTRGVSDSSAARSSGGLFRSISKATAQVEEARLLAERAMYLGSRIPLMTGAFANVWVSSLLQNPEVSSVVSDLRQMSDVSNRLATVAEKLPDDIAKERQATIDQLVDRISKERYRTVKQVVGALSKEREATILQIAEQVAKERRQTIEEFVAEEKRIRGLLTDLKLTLQSGNEVLVSTNAILERLNLQQAQADTGTPARPFDISEYQATLQEASGAISQIHDLVKTLDQMGLDKTLPLIVSAFEKAEEKGARWVLQAFMLGVLLILIFLIGAVFAMVLYRYMIHRMFQADRIKKTA